MHIVAIGDIGVTDDMIHIGDEAMFEQLVRELRARGIDDIVGLSANPADSSARYGIRSIPRIGFAGSREAVFERMRRVLAGEIAAGDPAWAVIAAIESSDGVAIAGGGNMTSIWPTHIAERATLGVLAARFGKPVVVSGQTIGPVLVDDDAAMVSDLLTAAALVGLREGASFELCTRLGIPGLTQTIDDASYLGHNEPTGGYCLVTLASHVGDHERAAVTARLAELLDAVVTTTGLEVVFSPHFGSTIAGVVRGDSVMHEAVAELMTSPSRSVDATDSAASARLARGASLVVSSRYHPVVFAMPGGVPAIGIAVDDYTTVKLTGALGNFGQHSVLTAESLVAGDGPALLAHVWGDRATTRAAVPDRHAESAAWWDRVADVFRA